MDHYKKLANMYHSLPMSKRLQTIIKITEGRAELSMPVKQDQKHAADALHGMYYFKMLDDSAFFAANSLVTDVFLLTSQFNLYFTKPVFSGNLRANGEVKHKSKNQIIAEATMYNENNEQVASGTGTFVRSSIKLESNMGYQL